VARRLANGGSLQGVWHLPQDRLLTEHSFQGIHFLLKKRRKCNPCDVRYVLSPMSQVAHNYAGHSHFSPSRSLRQKNDLPKMCQKFQSFPAAGTTTFQLDPVVKQECVWHGPLPRPSTIVAERRALPGRSRGQHVPIKRRDKAEVEVQIAERRYRVSDRALT
jgi:hypothetical protein